MRKTIMNKNANANNTAERPNTDSIHKDGYRT